jgi:S1-C subfamily serine protease
VKPLLGLPILLAAAAAAGQTPLAPSGAWQAYPVGLRPARADAPHPAVVRIIVHERNGLSLGSGALVAVSPYHGLVVTNWHVVRDAAGPITVAFPDGFRSAATLLRTDRDWDLAALAIWRPNVEPIPLAAAPPRPGEPLSIAGYGDGSYRTITGRCTQYVSPGRNQPFEMVELSAPARNGDSGGPIFNSRGELAGVLFGTAGGETAGSYSGRVRWFLTPVINDFQRLQPDGALLAATTSGPSNQSGTLAAAARTPGPARPAPLASIHAGPTRIGPDIPGTGPALVPSSSIQAESPAGMAQVPESGIPVAIPAPAGDAGQQAPSEDGFWEQVKNVLAAVGAVAILFHALRLLVVTPAPQPKGKKDSS